MMYFQAYFVMSLFTLTVKATILLALTTLISRSMRRMSASTRHLVWALGLMGALALALPTPSMSKRPHLRVRIPIVVAPYPAVAFGTPGAIRSRSPSR